MKNHMWRAGDKTGLEGSNVIYLGKASNGEYLFVHMDTPNVETLSQLRQTVRAYTPPGDPNILNYRIVERYRPLIPEFLNP
jgi:hypothetical protein